MKAVNLINNILRGADDPEPEMPEVYYVGFYQDPRTTAEIVWHGEMRFFPDSDLWYRKEGEDWNYIQGESEAYPFTGEGTPRQERLIHHVHLDGLDPDSVYEFSFSENGNSKKFKTLDTLPVRVAMTSDCHANYETSYRVMAKIISGFDPDFCVVLGDLASCNGVESNFDRWDIFWRHWVNEMIDSEGIIIPIVPGIGNHDVAGGYGGSIPDDAPFFYAMFPWLSKAYYVLDIGTDLSIPILDTEHTQTEITGSDDQSLWLDGKLNDRSSYKHVVPFLHVGGWPYSRLILGSVRGRVRDHWHPIFENRGVTLVVSGHEHVYGRTPYIKDDQIDPDGVKYIGGGSWGPPVRECINYESTWFLEQTHGSQFIEGLDGPHPMDGDPADISRGRYFYCIDFLNDKRVVKSISSSNEVFHEFEQLVDT